MGNPWCFSVKIWPNPKFYYIVYIIYSIGLFLWTYHITIVCPTSKLHVAILFVKWKILNINIASRFVNCRWIPCYFAGIVQNSFCHNGNFIISVRTVIGDINIVRLGVSTASWIQTANFYLDTQLMKPNFNRTDSYSESIFSEILRKKYRPAQSVQIFGHPYHEMDIMISWWWPSNNKIITYPP